MLPPRVPGTNWAIKIGLRPLISRLSTCDLVTSFCTEADSAWRVAAMTVTSTVSVAAPGL